MFNFVALTGKLGRDPEVRHTSSGRSVGSFSVATDVGTKDNKRTMWVNVTAWAELADYAGENLRKGQEVTVVGRLEPEEYTKKDGTEVKTLKITANSIAPSIRKPREEKQEEDLPF